MFGKKKAPADHCPSCERSIRAGQKVCSCGKATQYMDFAERTKYEVEQWRAYRGSATA